MAEAKVALVCWNAGTGATKGTGCDALVNYATSKGIDTTGDNKQIDFLNEGNGTYVLTLDEPVNLKQGDRFCLRYSENSKDLWPHYHGGTYPALNGIQFSDDGADMEIGQNMVARQFVLKVQDDSKFTLWIYEVPLSAKSNYGLQVWDTASLKWDTSGGLNDVFKEVKEGGFPLPEKYKRTESDDRKFLAFRGPLNADEIAALKAQGADVAKWASDDYREGTKFAREAKTDLYVIDFTEAEGHPEGIHITVPLQAQAEDGGYDASSTDAKGVPMFYRNGIRFGFFDFEFPENKNRDTDHLRFVKWGHVFRLNEISRPLNAFPQFDANNKFTGFADDFGPLTWNGVTLDSDDFKNTSADQYKTKQNKLGDTRLLAEYPMYLKRIYLEVAYCEGNTSYKRFYLSFEGDYDMPASIQFEQKYIYTPATNATCVTSTPNIFRGVDAKMVEPAFRRFYNLRLEENGAPTDTYVQARLGCSREEYLSHTGKNHLLYDLDFRDGYTAETSRSLLNAAEQLIPYADATGTEAGLGVSSTIRIEAENGYYYNVDGNNKTPLNYNPSGLDTFIDAKEVGLLYDPEDEDCAPVKIRLTGEYNFPNQTKATKVDRIYDIESPFVDPGLTLSPNAWANAMSEDRTLFVSNLTWNAVYNRISNNGTLPVFSYAVGHYADNNSTASTDAAAYTHIYDGTTRETWLDKTEECAMSHTHNAGAVPAFDYHSHYNVEAVYNFAYATDGLWRQSRLIDNGDGRYDAEAFSLHQLTNAGRAAAEITDETNLTTAKGFKFVIRPYIAAGQATATFQENTQTTGIDTIGADTEATVEYFDLLGRRVANPQAGQLLIRRQGNTAIKVVFE